MKLPAYVSLASQSVRKMNSRTTTTGVFKANLSLWFRPKQFRMTISNAEELSMMEIGQTSTGSYEALLPPTESLVGMGVVVILCIVCAWYWNEQVVPISRTNLAISKSRGEVKEYLDELRVSNSKLAEKTNETLKDRASGNKAADIMEVDGHDTTSFSNDVACSRSDDRAFERWLFADWLVENKSERRTGRQKEPAIPILRSAKWNSGDNPVIVTAALMVCGLLLTAVNENISRWL